MVKRAHQVWCIGRGIISAPGSGSFDKGEELRGPVPERVEAKVEVLEGAELPDHQRLLIRFPVTRLSRVVAYLLVPKGLERGEKRPGIIALHGHHAGGIEAICGIRQTDYDPYALRAVRAGFVVLAPAWWGWPGRDGHVGFVRALLAGPRPGWQGACDPHAKMSTPLR